MSKVVLLSYLLLTACQQARATGSTAVNSPHSQENATPCVQPTTESNGKVTDPEGPRPGESIGEELAHLEAAFNAQPPDESWRAMQEERFRRAFADARRENDLARVECRHTLCRLTVLRTGNERARPLKSILAKANSEEDGFLSSFSIIVYPSVDRSQSVVYVSRNHYQLPDRNGNVVENPKQRPNAQ